jgi:hydroxylamine reductase
MFCYQCEQTAKGTGCTVQGVCGKEATTAALQDLLVYAVKGLARYAHRARQFGVSDREVDVFTVEALFSTVTNVNFDPARLQEWLRKLPTLRERAKSAYEKAARGAGKTPEELKGPAAWQPAETLEGLAEQGEAIGIESRRAAWGDDVTGLQELVTYGLKGMAAYADHAQILGFEEEAVWAFFHEALDYLAADDPTVDALVSLALRTGEMNLRVMELLDAAHTGSYGDPEPTAVRVEPLKGKAILVSGHDLRDLAELLKQTEGKGINVYTHGEMLPAHAYPELKKHKHLAGNFGSAWQNQRKEFADFPGAILMTTNCLQRPQESYQARIFTSGLVAWPGVTHIADRNFAPVIEAARAAEGFAEDGPEKTILVGFGHSAVMAAAGKVVDLVKRGKIRHFFLVGGCDGAKPGRDYYTRFVELAPKDTVILTLACGKYRFNKLDFGEIEGLPRLLDIGQCNDAYSAVKIASALAEAFGTDVNGLPLSLILSWYEQKAVAILLTLLHLGIKQIRIGPSLPAFVTPPVLQVLVDKFGLTPITTPEEDLKAILG